MALTLQAVVALDHSKAGSGLSSLTQLASNASGAMMMAFGGVTGEIFAMTKAFGAAGAAVGVMKQSITVGASFEQQMANVASVTGLVGDELDQVASAARDMAKETKFTATEAATALYSLGSAGMNTADGLINTLHPALLLAGATQSDTKVTTETLTAALAAFSLPASEATNVANQLAGAIASSPATMERMADAMKAAGPAAASLGISLEKAVAEVAMFNLVGLRGEMAGQAFRQVLTQLSKQAKDSSTEIGAALKGWDSSTEGITGAVRRLNSAGVTSKFVFTELGQRAGPALALLMKKGADAMDNLAARITASADVQKIYNIQMDTLIGKFSIFKSAIEEIWHVLFTKMSPALQQASDEMTKVADAVSKLIKAMLAGDWLTVAEMFSTLWDNITSGVKGVFESVREYAGKMADVFKNINWGDSFSTLTTSAVAAFTNIWTEAQSSISKISAFLKGQDWGAVWDNVKQGAITAFNFWYGTATEIWEKIATFLRGINGADLWDAMKSGTRMVWSEIESIAKSIWPTIQAYAQSVWAAISEAGRVAFKSMGSAVGQIDWAGSFATIKTALWNGLQNAYQVTADWVTSMAMMIREIDWGEIGRMAFEAVIKARDFIVDGLNTLVSGGLIADVFQRVGQVIGALLKAAFQGIGGWFAAAWEDLVSGNWAERVKGFYTDIFIGGLQAITGLFTGILEGLFGKNVIDNIIAGAMLMMLEIKQAIQSKIGDILNAFNLLMAGIITKTTEGAATVAEVFGFSGMADKIRDRAQEFSDAFSSGTNGMIEAADATGEEIKALEQYIADLNVPAATAGESVAELGIKTAAAANSMIDLATASGTVNLSLSTGQAFFDKFTSQTNEAYNATLQEVIAMRAFAPASAAMGMSLGSLGEEMTKATPAAKEMATATETIKVSITDLVGMLAAFKGSKISAFDISDFVDGMKQLKRGLEGFSLPEIKLPDFSKFSIPKIHRLEMSTFISAMKTLATGLKDVIFGDLKIPDFSAIKIPNISSHAVDKFLTQMKKLKNGMMNIDFGELGKMDIDIKGDSSGAASSLSEILGLLKGAKGVIWA